MPYNNNESMLTLKAGAILVAAASFIVFIVTTITSHNSRITVLETNYTHVCASLNEIKGTLVEIQKAMNNRHGDNRK